MHRVSHPSSQLEHKSLYRLNSDLAGPMRLFTPKSEKYMLSVTDTHVTYAELDLLKHKSDSFPYMKDAIVLFESQTGDKVKRYRTDGGGEFLNQHCIQYFKEKGMYHKLLMIIVCG